VFWNPGGSWISSFYWAEYVAHFRRCSPTCHGWGSSRRSAAPATTSAATRSRPPARPTAYRTFEHGDGNPITIRGPWDPYNVAEDADLAFRLAVAGYEIGMLDSVTYEEAPRYRAKPGDLEEWFEDFRTPAPRDPEKGFRR